MLISSAAAEGGYVLNSMPIDSASGELSLPSESHVDPQKVSLLNGTVYAAPLCASRDGSHVYVVYPIENVSLDDSYP